MTAADLPGLQGKLGGHVGLTRRSGEEIHGGLLEVCNDGVSIEVDADSDHDMAGTLIFIALEEIVSVRETPRRGRGTISL